MTYQEWYFTYRPVSEEPFTEGYSLEFVKAQDPARVWSYGCNEYYYITNGWHVVNITGYFVTQIPCEPDTHIYIRVKELSDDEYD